MFHDLLSLADKDPKTIFLGTDNHQVADSVFRYLIHIKLDFLEVNESAISDLRYVAKEGQNVIRDFPAYSLAFALA